MSSPFQSFLVDFLFKLFLDLLDLELLTLNSNSPPSIIYLISSKFSIGALQIGQVFLPSFTQDSMQ